MHPSIRPDRTLSRPALWIALAVALAAGAGLWNYESVAPRGASASIPRVGTGAATSAEASAPSTAAPPMKPQPASTPFVPSKEKPAALTSHEWDVVQARAAAASQPGPEAARMADYIAFQKIYLEWRSLAGDRDPGRRDSLGQRLLDGLPAQVQQGSVALQQARSIQDEVLAARVPDASQRAPLLDAERQRLPAQGDVVAFPQ